MSIGGAELATGSVPGQLEDLETAAKLSRVSESLKLAEGGKVGISFLREQPIVGLGSEPSSLGSEGAGASAERDRDLGDGGEIDVGGDVELAGAGKWIFRCAVLAKGAQGAFGASGVVVFRAGKAVIRPQHQPRRQTAAQGFEKILQVAANFGAVALGKVGAQRGECGKQARLADRVVLPDELILGVGRDPAFEPSARSPLNHVKGQGIEQFVAKDHARQRLSQQLGGAGDEARCP